MLNLKRFGLCAVVVLMVAASAMASNFRAGDTVYLPSAGHVASGSVTYVTDAYITNLTANTVEVSIGFALTGGTSNASTPSQTVNINPALAPNERRFIGDITNALFPSQNGKLGYLIFFACRQGGNCTSCDTNPADCSLISVESRIYASSGAGAPTFGQLFPGLPWWNFVSSADAGKGLDKVFITGFRQEGARGVSGYRSNFGILNASMDYTITVRASVFTGTGSLVASKDYELPPLAHVQKPITDAAPTFATSGTIGYMLLEMVGSPVLAPGGCAACDPGFMAFGSVADNLSDDPTTLESQYLTQPDIGCIYGSKAAHRPVRKP